jgi:hypothetical protein
LFVDNIWLLGVLLGSKRTQELVLLFGSLESSVTQLGTGIDELEVDGLQLHSGSVLHHGLTKDQRTLLDTNDGTLKHDPVFVDLTIMNETTHGGNALGGQISVGLATSVVTLLTHTVHLLVEFGTVKVTVLTGTGNSGGNTGRMPRSDTSNLTQTTMSLTRQTSDTPTGDDTLVTVTLGNSKYIHVLVLAEDRVKGNLLLEKGLGKVWISIMWAFFKRR